MGIDASFIDPGRVGGAEHMVVNLVEGLAASSEADDTLVVFTDHAWTADPRVRFEPLQGPGNRFTRIAATLRPRLGSFERCCSPTTSPRRSPAPGTVHVS